MNTINGSKQKNNSTLGGANLTEGRIFVVFISFIILIVIVIFGFIILLSNSKKGGEVNVSTTNDQFENLGKSNDYIYYSDLTGEPDKLSIKDKKDLAVETDQNISDNNNAVMTNNFVVSLKDKDIKDTSSKENSVSMTESKNNDAVKENEVVKLDDSEVLYSSKEHNKVSADQKDTVKIKVTREKDTSVKIKKSTSNQISKNFIIQVGSYSSKELAKEISSYYTKKGYQAFIKEKKNDGKTFYRLRVGPFNEKELAERSLASLKDTKYGKDSYISVVYL
jgi:cell division septation protein DedD